MSKQIDDLFKKLKHDFDFEMPDNGHENRFLNKLQNNHKAKVITLSNKYNLWKPFIGIAASVALILSIFNYVQQEDNSGDLSSVSPKMAETQDFFTLTINEELNNINQEFLPEVQGLIKDALSQIKKLEEDYNSLKIDLIESGDDNRVIYAMISNFQNRIEILKNTINEINKVKQLKNSSNHETSTTI